MENLKTFLKIEIEIHLVQLSSFLIITFIKSPVLQRPGSYQQKLSCFMNSGEVTNKKVSLAKSEIYPHFHVFFRTSMQDQLQFKFQAWDFCIHYLQDMYIPMFQLLIPQSRCFHGFFAEKSSCMRTQLSQLLVAYSVLMCLTTPCWPVDMSWQFKLTLQCSKLLPVPRS